MKRRRVEWNLRGAERGPAEVQVKFSNELDLDDNLETVIEILRDRYDADLEGLDLAIDKVFGENEDYDGVVYRGPAAEKRWAALMEGRAEPL